jgi:hypothetical protein
VGFTSQDQLINDITVLGQYLKATSSKITSPVHTAGGWHSTFGMNGFPNPTTYPAAADLVWHACTEQGGDGTTILGIQHGGNVQTGTVTKNGLSTSVLAVAAAGAPWQLKLVDLEGYYRLATTNVTGTGSRILINTNVFTADAGTNLITYTNDFTTFTKVRFTTTGTLPAPLALATDYYLIRASATTASVAASLSDAVANVPIDITDAGTGTHTLTIQMRNPNGVGCEAFFCVQTAPTLGGPSLTASSYTNTAGTAARAFQGSPTMGAAADAYATRVLHSGNAAGRYGPFLPKQGADTGIRSVESFTWSAGTAYTGTGVMALCIARPILDIMLPATGALSERDLVNQIMSMPQILDGACLGWMLFGTGATTTNSPITSTIDFAWGG